MLGVPPPRGQGNNEEAVRFWKCTGTPHGLWCSGMNGPKVSVCIGAYNRKDYIRECVDSVLAQTWPDREIIVVDDASTDGTREILQAYGDSIRLILRETNSGICPITRNQAAAAARGEYVAFLDSDDLWPPARLQRQLWAL